MNKIWIYVALLFIAFPCAYASETRCSFGDEIQVDTSHIGYGSDSTGVDIVYPKVKGATLKYVRLWYGEEEELFVELPFEEEKSGYAVDISVSGEHEIVRLTAIYHYQVCYAQINVVIESHRARQMPNS